MDTGLKPIDRYFRSLPEPAGSCMLAMRALLLQPENNLSEDWKYGMPFYCYKGKMCFYLWTRKGSGQPYLGLVDGKLLDHPLLLQESRRRMKILPLDPEADLPVALIKELLDRALALR